MADATLLEEAQGLLPDAIDLRRRLHTWPELGLDLPGTQQAVLEALDGVGLEVTVGERVSSVVAVLEGERPGPTTLLRGDMDALPMPEDTGLDYASTVDGAMHACGHDAHVAMLAGAARLLTARRDELGGRVVFMFQPGEEGFAGAPLHARGGPARATRAGRPGIRLHVTPLISSGHLASRGGALMASADAFRIRITGRGGHASMPHDATDPVPVACEIVMALQAMVTRRGVGVRPRRRDGGECDRGHDVECHPRDGHARRDGAGDVGRHAASSRSTACAGSPPTSPPPTCARRRSK